MTEFAGAWQRVLRAPKNRAALFVLLALTGLALLSGLMPEPVYHADGALFSTVGYLEVLARTVLGARVTFEIILVLALVAPLPGVIWGLIAGAGPRWVDFTLIRGVELSGLWPTFILMAVLRSAEATPHVTTWLAVLGAQQCLRVALVVRGEALRLRALPYVQAARAFGASPLRVLTVHILPGVMAPVWVTAAMGAAYGIASEAALSFVGLGLPAAVPTWGAQLAEVRNVPLWTTIPPALGITLTTWAMLCLADALDDALSPKRRDR